ncbi:MAG TPA: serine hydrolase [Gemmatimonadales bacterium]|nr:serine hydrolase [Gemmatimonadales bacterium]
MAHSVWGNCGSCIAALLLLPAALSGQTSRLDGLQTAMEARIHRDTATVGVALVDLATGREIGSGALTRFHAASTMKVPVLIELSRRVDAGDFRWDDSILVRNAFRSLADGSTFTLDKKDDSDSTVYDMVGQREPIRLLARLMIIRSSNLATNLLIDQLGAARVNATAHALGADSIQVRRGVEDQKAFDRGMNNTTTARDLAILLAALEQGKAASAASSAVALDMLLGQEFNDGIPAGLPAGTRVAHKTGELTAVFHDAALIYPPGRAPFILVVLTRGFGERADAMKMQSDLARLAWAAVVGS